MPYCAPRTLLSLSVALLASVTVMKGPFGAATADMRYAGAIAAGPVLQADLPPERWARVGQGLKAGLQTLAQTAEHDAEAVRLTLRAGRARLASSVDVFFAMGGQTLVALPPIARIAAR
jgi:outer membrane receptor protein involved in Fe transport